ncbi:MAG: SRPBCC family protein [Proteobacteria bacterium]|nr:SRPBCC family protein [Pseudomonadota bacterium]
MDDKADRHSARAEVSASPDLVFAYLTDPARIGRWNLGAIDAVRLSSGAVQGTSMFDGGATVFEIDANSKSRTVDYRVGKDQGNLALRISARVEGAAPGGCVLHLSAERPRHMDDARWHRLCAVHEVEVLLIKSQAESETEAR